MAWTIKAGEMAFTLQALALHVKKATIPPGQNCGKRRFSRDPNHNQESPKRISAGDTRLFKIICPSGEARATDTSDVYLRRQRTTRIIGEKTALWLEELGASTYVDIQGEGLDYGIAW